MSHRIKDTTPTVPRILGLTHPLEPSTMLFATLKQKSPGCMQDSAKDATFLNVLRNVSLAHTTMMMVATHANADLTTHVIVLRTALMITNLCAPQTVKRTSTSVTCTEKPARVWE